MSYATSENMVARFGEMEMIDLTNHEYRPQIDYTVLDEAVMTACEEIDGYIGGCYPLPLAQPPKILMVYACDMARYRLYSVKERLPEFIRDRYLDALRFLTLVATGRVVLAGGRERTLAPTENTVQFAPSARRVFARDGENGAWF